MTKEKSLSQQICELCGIEYEKLEPDYRVQDDNGDICEYYSYKLDFKTPENFVKLYELKIDEDNTLGWFLTLTYENIYTREDFLDALIDYLTTTDDLFERVKQAIRDYDGWVWG